MRRSFTFALMVVPIVAGCGIGASARPSANPTPSPSVEPTVGIVATFQVGGEQFRVELTDPVDIDIARRLLRGDEAPGIPNGIVVRGDPGVNRGYSWHIDPASLEFADVTTEVCDGLPSDVEANLITSDRFCPWQAALIEIAQ